jgi:hypothetical protein
MRQKAFTEGLTRVKQAFCTAFDRRRTLFARKIAQTQARDWYSIANLLQECHKKCGKLLPGLGIGPIQPPQLALCEIAFTRASARSSLIFLIPSLAVKHLPQGAPDRCVQGNEGSFAMADCNRSSQPGA